MMEEEEFKGLYGELPTKPVVFAACDEKYFLEHAPAFAYSADNIGKNVHIHVINPSDKVFALASVIQGTTKVETTFSYHDHNDARNMDPEQQRTLYACVRFIVLPHIVRSADKVLTCDIDQLFMQEFDFPKTPIGFFPRTDKVNAANEWEANGMKVAAGAVYANADAVAVVDAIHTSLQEAPLRWFVDQIVLSKVFEQVGDAWITHFDSQFMDWEFKEGTTIWTGKGPRKHDNPKYVAKKKEIGDVAARIEGYEEVLLRPRLDIPFKRFGLSIKNSVNEPIRAHWANFCDRIAETDKKILQIEMPRWEFNCFIQDYFSEDVTFYVPHEERAHWGGHDNTYFYMQTVFPWLFSIDHEGWGGGAQFINTFDPTAEYDTQAFDTLSKYTINGGTKFAHLQPDHKFDHEDLLKDEFIFVPLQIPHDQVIRNHSAITVPEFVKALCEWAEKVGNPQVVFKGHPVNPSSMVQLMEIIEQYDNVLFLSDVHIHEMIKKATATYVINSGVGQEAMLLDETVVGFGGSEYLSAIIPGDITKLNDAWKAVKNVDKDKQGEMYRRWYDWYAKSLFDSSKSNSGYSKTV